MTNSNFSAFRITRSALALVLALSTLSSAASLDSLQKAFVSMKYGMFVHFNMGTYTMSDLSLPGLNPDQFNPDSLDCGKWADAAAAAGMKYMVLTVKHHDGFCLWNSAFTKYGVASSKWRGGKGDVVREFVDSCRSRGLAVGLYFSIWDRDHAKDADTTFIKNQITELLTNYGPIALLWFDGWGWQIPYTAVPWETVRMAIKAVQPNCLAINNSQEHNLSRTEVVEWEKGGHAGTSISDTNSLPSEMCETVISSGKWFYPGPALVNNLYSAAVLTSLLQACNSRNANLLLDVSPDQNGVIPASQVARIRELGMTPTTIRPYLFVKRDQSFDRSVGARISIWGSSSVSPSLDFSSRSFDLRGREFGQALQKAARLSANGSGIR